MMSLIGIPIGFYGYLMPSTINLMVLKLYNDNRIKLLVFVIALILLFESLYCFATLYFIQYLFNNQQLFGYIQISAAMLSIALGIWMFVEKKGSSEVSENSIYRGLFSIVIHPQQITFWVFVSVLMPKIFGQIMSNSNLPLFVLCNSIGTLLIILTYAFVGSKMVTVLQLNLNNINKMVGVLYVIAGFNSFFNVLIN